MKCRLLSGMALLVSLSVIVPSTCLGQDTLLKSPTALGKALRAWFPEKIEIHGSAYYNSRIRCSNTDLTHFSARAGKANTGLGPAFQIEGSLRLDALPSGLEVFDGAQGAKYMLLFQGYLFSSEGELLWSQQGFPKGGAWVAHTRSSTRFMLIDEYTGSLKGCTAAVLAAGDPILVEGTSETCVILGIAMFSFRDETDSTTLDPAVSIAAAPPKSDAEADKPEPSPKRGYASLEYVEKKLRGWRYMEVVSIPVSERKKIFYELVDYQDRTGDDEGAHEVIATRYGLPKRAASAIASEGALKKWPMPKP